MIYLSSYRLGNDTDVLRRQQPGGRAGIVLNALDVYGDTRARDWDREAGDLERLGYASEEIDLREYFDDGVALSRRLADLHLVWVVGGNAFVLARAMYASGFREALIPELHRGLIYGGYSAGACVAGPDLRGVDLIDDPNIIPDGYESGMPFSTLGLVPFRIVPHWQSDHPESEAADRAAALLEQEDLAYRPLRDGEALVLDAPGKDGDLRS